MNSTQLRAFQAVAETGSFGRGAERLLVSQPAVSLHVAALERSLKTKLLDRLPRGVALTEAGRTLLGFVQQIARIEQAAAEAMAELSGLRRGQLRIGGSTTVGAYLLPPIIARFNASHPSIRTELTVANTTDIEQQLLDGQLDLGVTEGVADHEDLAARVVFKDELVLIVPPTHALAKQPTVHARQLAKYRLMLREVGSGTREVIERALARQGVDLGETLTIGGTEAIKQSVIAGLGIAIVSRLTIGLEIAAGKLTIVSMPGLKLSRPLHLLNVKGRTISTAGQAFIDLLKTPEMVQ